MVLLSSVFWVAMVGAVLAGTPTASPKPQIDKTKPVRMEQFLQLRQGQRELATVLASSRLVLDSAARDKAQSDFHRYLLRFADGAKVALYGMGDYSNERFALIRIFFVDANGGDWILLTMRQKTGQPGYGVVKALPNEEFNPWVSVETRSLRLTPDLADTFFKDQGRSAPVRTAEPKLVELLQTIRKALPDRPAVAASVGGGLVEQLADFLQLPQIAGCAECTVETVRRSLTNDEPQAVPPLDPDFEAEFGKWVTWNELPKVKK